MEPAQTPFVSLQSAARGYIARNQFKKEREAIITLQSVVRVHLAKVETANILLAGLKKSLIELHEDNDKYAPKYETIKAIKKSVKRLFTPAQDLPEQKFPIGKIQLDSNSLKGHLIYNRWPVNLSLIGRDSDKSYTFEKALELLVEHINSNIKPDSNTVTLETNSPLIKTLFNMTFIEEKDEDKRIGDQARLSFLDAALMVLKERGHLIECTVNFFNNRRIRLRSSLIQKV